MVVAAQGPCLGIGRELSAGCDFRFAVEHAVFGLPEVRNIAALPGSGGISRLAVGVFAVGTAGAVLVPQPPLVGPWLCVTRVGLGGGAMSPLGMTIIAWRSADAAGGAAVSGRALGTGYTVAAAGPYLVGLLVDTVNYPVALSVLLVAAAAQATTVTRLDTPGQPVGAAQCDKPAHSTGVGAAQGNEPAHSTQRCAGAVVDPGLGEPGTADHRLQAVIPARVGQRERPPAHLPPERRRSPRRSPAPVGTSILPILRRGGRRRPGAGGQRAGAVSPNIASNSTQSSVSVACEATTWTARRFCTAIAASYRARDSSPKTTGSVVRMGPT